MNSNNSNNNSNPILRNDREKLFPQVQSQTQSQTQLQNNQQNLMPNNFRIPAPSNNNNSRLNSQYQTQTQNTNLFQQPQPQPQTQTQNTNLFQQPQPQQPALFQRQQPRIIQEQTTTQQQVVQERKPSFIKRIFGANQTESTVQTTTQTNGLPLETVNRPSPQPQVVSQPQVVQTVQPQVLPQTQSNTIQLSSVQDKIQQRLQGERIQEGTQTRQLPPPPVLPTVSVEEAQSKNKKSSSSSATVKTQTKVVSDNKTNKKKGKRMSKKDKYEQMLAKVDYSNEAIFDKKFSTKTKHVKCAIDYLTLNQFINKRGKLKKSKVGSIRKRYIWQYLYYLRLNNKATPLFKEHLGKGYAFKPNKLFLMIKENVHGADATKFSVSKDELRKFIEKLFNETGNGKDLNIPFMKWYTNTDKIKNDKLPSKPKKNKPKKTSKISESLDTRLTSINTRLQSIQKRSSSSSSGVPKKIDTEIKIITDKPNGNKIKKGNNAKNSNIKITANAQLKPKST